LKIVIRACGERTEKKCIELAEKQGKVHVIREVPFGEAVKKTYEYGIQINQKWLPVIDADVLLYDGVLERAIRELNAVRARTGKNIFCLDGKTKDKIMMTTRRAGVHIYNTSLLRRAIQYIDYNHIKPESTVRRKMALRGLKTHVGKIVFGLHDYEQYYKDLWRKSVCQTQKLARKIRKTNRVPKWAALAKKDIEFKVIYQANLYGKKFCDEIIIDRRKNYNATKELRRMGIKEKGELNK